MRPLNRSGVRSRSTWAAVAGFSERGADPLTNILVFRYGGADGGDRASQFDEFRKILDSKAKSIAGLFANLQEATYLAQVNYIGPQARGASEPRREQKFAKKRACSSII